MSAKPKILFLGAMEKEISGLLEFYSCVETKKILDTYPLFSSTQKNIDISIVQTHVGDTNATVAATEAIRILNPDYVFKIGCVGGNSAGVHSGDIIIPTGFFHSGSWITRSRIDNTPTSDASLWQSVFGEKPYQVNSENLGGHPYLLEPNKKLSDAYTRYLSSNNLPFVPSYLGGGNMWFFDLKFMKEVLKMQVPKAKIPTWVADMESYAIAYVCSLYHKPFFGFYRVSNSDYYDEPYIPEKVANLFSRDFVSKIAEFVDQLKG